MKQKILTLITLLLLGVGPALGQTITAKGRVVDENNEGIPTATIRLKSNPQKGTFTDMNGNFVLDAKQGEIIIVSFVGYKTQEVAAAPSLKISLVPNAEMLEDVVVTGYQKIDRKMFTGSAERVEMDQLKIGGEADLSKLLEGRVAGVSVQNVSSTFGTAPKVFIRGSSSIYGNQAPLWVVDGIVLEDAVQVSADQINSGNLAALVSSGVAGINMDDIESMQILKDVSATALYGARAMNGVIVITTKKGRSGTVGVNYSSSLTYRPKPSYNEYNILNSAEQMQVNKELYEKGWINVARTQFESIHGPYGKMFDMIKNKELNWVDNQSQMESFLRRYETANTDWFDILFTHNLLQNHTLSFSGGSDKSSIYASLGVLHDGGWSIADKLNRYTGMLKGTFKLSKKLSIMATGNMSYRTQQLSGVSNVSNDVGGVNRYTGKVERDFDNNPFIYALSTSRAIRPYNEDESLEFFRRNFVDYNILDELSKNQSILTVRDMSFNLDVNYKILRSLSFTSKLSARYFQSRRERRIHENSNEANAYRAGMRATDSEVIRDLNTFLYERPGSVTGEKFSILPEGGMLNTVDNAMTNYYFTSNLNYDTSFGENHRVNLLLGSEVRYIDRQETYNEGYGHSYEYGHLSKPSPNLLEYMQMTGQSYYGLANTYDRFAAFFFNYGYSYLNRYTLNGTVRLDGSNRLGRSMTARWLPTWNIGAKWTISEEEWMEGTHSWLDILSLKVAYGLNATLGSASNAVDLYYSTLTHRPMHPTASELSIDLTDIENRDLTWEKQYEANVGLDATFLKGRLGIGLNLYHRKGFDLIGLYRGNGVGGQMLKVGNVANMKSLGLEFSINATPVKTNDFNWTTNLNLSVHNTKVTDLFSNSWVSRAVSIFGVPVLNGPVRGIYSTRFAGLDERGIPTFFDRNNERVHYLDVQTSDLSDLEFSGNLEPPTNIGFSNTVSYKGISLSVLLTGQFGHKKRVMQDFSYSYSDYSALSSHLQNRWRVAGDETVTNIPAILDMSELTKDPNSSRIGMAYNLYGMSDLWLADASFVRIKNLGISYQLPKKFCEAIRLKSLSVGLQGTNLGLVWIADRKKLGGEDPEFVWSGGTTMPITRQYSFSLNIGL